MSFSGKWHGTTFRSLLELSLMHHLVAEGFTLGSTILYEEHRIPYGRDGRRTYVVDLSLPEHRIMIEVKPESRVLNRNNWTKRKAALAWAEQHGWEYLVITEREIGSMARVLLLEEAAEIPGVILNERAQRALRRKMNRRKRRR